MRIIVKSSTESQKSGRRRRGTTAAAAAATTTNSGGSVQTIAHIALLYQILVLFRYFFGDVATSILPSVLQMEHLLSTPMATTRNMDNNTTANTSDAYNMTGGGHAGSIRYFDATTERIKPFFLFDHDTHIQKEKEGELSFWRDRICPVKNENTNNLTYLEGDGGRQILQKTRRHNSPPEHQQQQQRNVGPNGVREIQKKNKKKILCMVYTVYTNDDPHLSVESQARTWGRQCDGFFAASNMTQQDINAVDLPHDGEEVYGNMWQKVRSMWLYAYRHYLNDYDFFHICGTDVYVNVPNMRSYLDGPEVEKFEYDDAFHDVIFRWKVRNDGSFNASKTTSISSLPRPVFLGIPVMFRKLFYPAGGPGYTMNRRALEIFGSKSLQTCMADFVDSREDVFVASCLELDGVVLSDTRHGGTKGTRYGESAESEYFGLVPYKDNIPQVRIYYNEAGLDRVSDDFFSFHLKNEKQRLAQLNRSMSDLMYRYHAVLHGYEDKICYNENDPGAGISTSQEINSPSHQYQYI